MPTPRDWSELNGKRFDRVTVISAESFRRVTVRCDCGKEVRFAVTRLRSSIGIDCGCRLSKKSRRLLFSRVPGYTSWWQMISRCSNPRSKDYAVYGARGIRVCERWMASFDAFIEDVGERPGPEYSIDRYPNPAGNYEPGNARWATALQQARNQVTTVRYPFQGEQLTCHEIADRVGMSFNRLRSRLAKGWTLEKAISYQRERLVDVDGKHMTLRQAAEHLGISYSAIRGRLYGGYALLSCRREVA